VGKDNKYFVYLANKIFIGRPIVFKSRLVVVDFIVFFLQFPLLSNSGSGFKSHVIDSRLSLEAIKRYR